MDLNFLVFCSAMLVCKMNVMILTEAFLCFSRWIITQQKTHSEVPVSSNKEEVPGQSPSYKDPVKLTFGCKHYKRNCKLVAACCNRIYACRLCHDDVADHSMDRYIDPALSFSASALVL